MWQYNIEYIMSALAKWHYLGNGKLKKSSCSSVEELELQLKAITLAYEKPLSLKNSKKIAIQPSQKSGQMFPFSHSYYILGEVQRLRR